MFTCTPRDANSFFVTCNDRDLEKLKEVNKIDTQNKPLDMVYLCDVLEKMLNDVVEGVESEKKQQKAEIAFAGEEETRI